jgi:cell wall assembly regulator SMI1
MTSLESAAPITARSILSGASTDTVDEAMSVCPHRWPDDLIEYFTVQGGQTAASDMSDSPGELIPHLELLSIEACMRLRAVLLEDLGGQDADDEQDPDPVEAGEPAGRYLPGYIPIADGDGNYLYCDTRPGPRYGLISAYSIDEADEGVGVWPSITGMVNNVDDSLTVGTAVRYFKPNYSSGSLRWEAQDDGDRYRAKLDEIHNHYLEYPDGYAPPVQLPTGDGIDLMRFQRECIELAAATYGGHHNITQVMIAPFYVPRIVGQRAGCSIAIRGVLREYLAIVTDSDGSYRIEPPAHK